MQITSSPFLNFNRHGFTLRAATHVPSWSSSCLWNLPAGWDGEYVPQTRHTACPAVSKWIYQRPNFLWMYRQVGKQNGTCVGLQVWVSISASCVYRAFCLVKELWRTEGQCLVVWWINWNAARKTVLQKEKSKKYCNKLTKNIDYERLKKTLQVTDRDERKDKVVKQTSSLRSCFEEN